MAERSATLPVKPGQRPGITAGMVIAIFGTAHCAATLQAQMRTETFIKRLGFGAPCIGLVWFSINRFRKARGQPDN